MAILPQRSLFSWRQVDEIGDLDRLRLVLENLPDEELMRALEKKRGNGRDDYPIRAVWNSIIAGVVFQHRSIQGLRRELQRNAQMRYECGFDPLQTAAKSVPSAWAYSRFIGRLPRHVDLIDAMFDRLVDQLRAVLPGFGRVQAIDSKAIKSHAKPRKKGEKPRESAGRRAEHDADFGRKTYRGKRDDGTTWEKLVSWFGFKIHLVVDAEYELPVGMEVTKASKSDIAEGRELIEKISKRHPRMMESCEELSGDKGYDDTTLIETLWDEHGVKPVIDIRNMWKDGEPTKLVPGTRNVVHDYKGTVSCCCPATGELRAMPFGGFEKGRETLKYRCPAAQRGFTCAGREKCGVKNAVRIPLSVDRRVFTPLARSSKAWKREYKKRTSVERVNSRLDVSFGFENHFIRGLKKMRVCCGIALIVMLAMALGSAKENHMDRLRSLVKPRAG